MQDHLAETFEKEPIVLDRAFLEHILSLIQDDTDTQQLFFGTLFDKMHMNLGNIRVEKMRQAEEQIEKIKILVSDYKEA